MAAKTLRRLIRLEPEMWERLARVSQNNPGTIADHVRYAVKTYLDTRYPEPTNGDTHDHSNGAPVAICHQ